MILNIAETVQKGTIHENVSTILFSYIFECIRTQRNLFKSAVSFIRIFISAISAFNGKINFKTFISKIHQAILFIVGSVLLCIIIGIKICKVDDIN